MKTLPRKQTINIRGAVFEYASAGTGSPGIVLINGAGGPIEA